MGWQENNSIKKRGTDLNREFVFILNIIFINSLEISHNALQSHLLRSLSTSTLHPCSVPPQRKIKNKIIKIR